MNADFAETVEAEAPATALVVFKPATLAAYNNGVLDAVEKVAAEARARVAGADVSTEAGREVIRSTAYKVARSKTALDDLGAELVAEQKRTAKAVDESRREMRGKLDAVKEEIRKPLTEFEEAEAARVAEHEAAIADIEMLLLFSDFAPRTSIELKQRLELLRGRPSRDWQEFKMRAQTAMVDAERTLERWVADAVKRECDAAELARLQREQAEREQRERDERIAREAADRALREAEEKAELRRVQAMNRAAEEQSRRDAEAAVAQRAADQARAAAEERARKAEQEAERKAAWAVENERVRVAKEAEADRIARERREADKKHRGKINAEARDAILLVLGGVAESTDYDFATSIVIAIAKGEIPHVTISY